jgi:hypothetical protein
LSNIRKIPKRRILNQEIVSRDIGSLVDKKSPQLGIVKSETLTRRRKLYYCGAQLTSGQTIEGRNIGDPVHKVFKHFDIAMSETPKGGKVLAL